MLILRKNTKLQIVSNIFITRRRSRWGFDYFIIKNELSKKFYWITGTEFSLLSLMESEIIFRELVEKVQSTFQSISVDEIREFIVKLFTCGLITVDQELWKESSSSRRGLRNLVFGVTIIPAEKLAEFRRRLHWAFLGKFKKLQFFFFFCLIAILIFLAVVTGFPLNLSMSPVSGSNLVNFGVTFYLLFIPIALVHELAHAVTCLYYGIKPGSVSIGISYFLPYLSTDTTEAWLLDKNKRIWISASGPISTVIIALSLWICSFFFLSNEIRTLLQFVGYFSFVVVLLNLCPFIEGDGYYILMDMLDIPNLRDVAFACIVKTLKLQRSESYDLPFDTTKVKVVLVGFGLISLFWTALLTFFGLRLISALAMEAWGSMILLASLKIYLMDIVKIAFFLVFFLYMVLTFVRYSKSALKALRSI